MQAATRANGAWKVTLRREPAYVNDRCTACGDCSDVCPAKVSDTMNLDMQQVPAIRLPYPNAWPYRFVLDRKACPDDCRVCTEACKYDAVDFGMETQTVELKVGAVVWATGCFASFLPRQEIPIKLFLDSRWPFSFLDSQLHSFYDSLPSERECASSSAG